LIDGKPVSCDMDTQSSNQERKGKANAEKLIIQGRAGRVEEDMIPRFTTHCPPTRLIARSNVN